MRAPLLVALIFAVACHGVPDSASGPPKDGLLADWPGVDDATTVDVAGALGGNVSGLVYDATTTALWAVRNNPSTLLRLVPSSDGWRIESNAPWSTGRPLRYPDDAGDPDAEGVTVSGGGASAGVYVVAERNNAVPSESRNSILRYDVSQSGITLRATHEWLLNAALPGPSPNAGIEAISWVPDSMLVANGFLDANTGQAYRPSDYPSHGTGIFFVGLEATGGVYAFALNHATNAAVRIAVIDTGLPAVMGMEYDAATGQLWITCDDGCGNGAAVLVLPTSGTRGAFQVLRRYRPPSSLPNVNNEGFALAPMASCTGGLRSAFWVDDANTGGHVLRRASRACVVSAAR
ncbi:MAG: hypothetical protein FJ363_04150 [Gemmatimonadetes bacterium]|nr:hypothetical protein [Gemmatimonadota bacterium]